MIIEDSHLVGEKYLMIEGYKGGDSLNVFKFENKKIVVAIWGDLWTGSLLNQLEKISMK